MGILIPRRSVLKLVAVASVSTTAGVAHADGLVVIANANVGRSNFSVAELATIFTTKRKNYDGGDRIIALNLPPRTSERTLFDQVVLGMDPEAVARYWIDRKVRGGDPPPKQVPSAALVARLVEKLPGAIGYVPASAAGNLKIVARL